jgi:hypothetical protein
MTATGLFHFAGAAFACVLLAACATADRYHARIDPAGSGYAEERIDETHWRVEFTGAGGDSRDIVESSLLYRAAELTASSGFDWFVSSAHEVDAETDVVVEARRVQASPVWRPQWRRNRSSHWTDWMPSGAIPQEAPARSSSRVTTQERFAARDEIIMGRGPAPEGAFDARRVLSDLATTVSGS